MPERLCPCHVDRAHPTTLSNGSMSSYLVTGGAGFIGSHLVQRLVADRQRVCVLDNLSTGKRENLEPFLDSIEFIEGDGTIDFIIPHLPFLQGSFLLTAAVFDSGGREAYDSHNQAYSFRVSPSAHTREEHGALEIPSEWRLGSALDLRVEFDGAG